MFNELLKNISDLMLKIVDYNSIPYLLGFISLALIVMGILVEKSKKKKITYMDVKSFFTLSELTVRLQVFHSLFMRTKKSISYILLRKFLNKYDSAFLVREFFTLKILVLFFCIFLYLFIGKTNTEAIRANIVDNISFSEFNKEGDTKYNAQMFKKIIEEAGEESLLKITKEERVQRIKQALAKNFEKDSAVEINFKAEKINEVFELINNIGFVDIKLAIVFFSFFFPELFVILNYFISKNKMDKEVIKLENIFLLLASIDGFKTEDILLEMERSTVLFGNVFEECNRKFLQEKDKSLKFLRDGVNNKRFKELIYQIGKYSNNDKEEAIKNVERMVSERKDNMYVSSNESLDFVDIVCLMGITPMLICSFYIIVKPFISMTVMFGNLNF